MAVGCSCSQPTNNAAARQHANLGTELRRAREGFEAGKQGPRKIILASGWLEFVLLRRLSRDPVSYHACRQFSNGRPQRVRHHVDLDILSTQYTFPRETKRTRYLRTWGTKRPGPLHEEWGRRLAYCIFARRHFPTRWMHMKPDDTYEAPFQTDDESTDQETNTRNESDLPDLEDVAEVNAAKEAWEGSRGTFQRCSPRKRGSPRRRTAGSVGTAVRRSVEPADQHDELGERANH